MKLNDTQLSQVDAQIKRLVKTDSYYGKKYRELGITDVTSQEQKQRKDHTVSDKGRAKKISG